MFTISMNKTILIGIVMVTAIGIGASSAYAVNIQLEGDSTVNGNLAVSGDITGPTMDAITTAISEAGLCPQQNVQHWDKIIYKPTLLGGDISFVEPQGETELVENKFYDVKVIDDPNKTIDLAQAVADKLNQLGYKKQFIQPPLRNINPDNILIEDVEYAIVCLKTPPT